MSLSLSTSDDFLAPFNIVDLPDLCIITGLNGSGKSRLLSKISSGQASLRSDGEVIPNLRILEFDSKSFNNYQFSNNDGGQYHHNHHDDTVWMMLDQFNYGTTYDAEAVRNMFRDRLGFMNSDFSNELQKAIEDGNLEFIRNNIRIPDFKKYSNSVAAALKNFYDLQVTAHMTEVARREGREAGVLNQPLDVERVLNSVLKKLGLNYEIYGGEEYKNAQIDQKFRMIGAILPNENNLASAGQESNFLIRLVNRTNHKVISINDLSSGEKSLLSIASVIAIELQNDESKPRPSVLLFDEPDAHLHPDYSSVLINVFREEFIGRYGFKIIMTTHSPITVALAELERSVLMESGIATSVDKQRAIAGLMTGVPHLDILNKNNVYIFVESHNDAKVFSGIFSILSKSGIYKNKPIFLPSSHGGGGGNCGLVEHLAISLKDNPIIYGIIDWDTRNIPKDNVYVHSYGRRYSIENLILDPLVLMCFLLSRCPSPRIGESIPEDISVDELLEESEILEDRVRALVEKILGRTSDSFIPCEYEGGISINISTDYLQMQGHELEAIIRQKLPQLKRYNQNLFDEIIRFLREYKQLIPQEFKECFDKILIV